MRGCRLLEGFALNQLSSCPGVIRPLGPSRFESCRAYFFHTAHKETENAPRKRKQHAPAVARGGGENLWRWIATIKARSSNSARTRRMADSISGARPAGNCFGVPVRPAARLSTWHDLSMDDALADGPKFPESILHEIPEVHPDYGSARRSGGAVMAAKKKAGKKKSAGAVQGKAKPAPKSPLPPAAVAEIRKICREEFKNEFARERAGLIADLTKRTAGILKVARRHCRGVDSAVLGGGNGKRKVPRGRDGKSGGGSGAEDDEMIQRPVILTRNPALSKSTPGALSVPKGRGDVRCATLELQPQKRFGGKKKAGITRFEAGTYSMRVWTTDKKLAAKYPGSFAGDLRALVEMGEKIHSPIWRGGGDLHWGGDGRGRMALGHVPWRQLHSADARMPADGGILSLRG